MKARKDLPPEIRSLVAEHGGAIEAEPADSQTWAVLCELIDQPSSSALRNHALVPVTTEDLNAENQTVRVIVRIEGRAD